MCAKPEPFPEDCGILQQVKRQSRIVGRMLGNLCRRAKEAG